MDVRISAGADAGPKEELEHIKDRIRVIRAEVNSIRAVLRQMQESKQQYKEAA